ncbi:MAG TPA: molybdopterin-dependent oxidoreductase [Aeromicrobium sp.]|nr:molybdopterin-dependent oxidoreductase [Aeromicrobium sp.]
MTEPRRTFALYGVVSALVGLAIGHLAAALIAPASSPVLVVGSTLIDLAPAPVKIAVIKWFGTADKPLLIALVTAGTLGIAVGAGIASRRRPTVGVGILFGLGLVVAILTATSPKFGSFGFIPALVAGAVSAGLLSLLPQWARGPDEPADSRAVQRRALLGSAGLLALSAIVFSASRMARRGPTPAAVAPLPEPATALPPLPRGLGASGITPLRTPMADFYRVDTRLSVPNVDPADWRLTIDGDVDRTVHFTYRQLLAMPMIERDITLACVSNPVGGPYAGGARWLGVPLTDLLKRAGSGSGKADQILSTDVGGMTISTPLDAATDGRDAMIAVGMNGQPLPAEHGYPARLVVPGLYGFIGATKWIRRMTLTTYAAQEAYWTPRGWATDAPIKLASRIDVPHDGDEVDAGDVVIGGIAWAPNDGGVGRVQVRIDDHPWRDATLGPSGGSAYWRQWFVRWDAPKGDHSIRVRVLGANGDVQTSKPAEPAPDGASGLHQVRVSVA